jgi:molybdopterin-biosynthesis enzyme MoeA-like protein
MTGAPVGGRPTAGAIIIASEVLTAKVDDANTPFLATHLRTLGVRLSRVVVIEDTIDAIADEVRLASRRFTHVFTSGGIGPTHDDVTFAGIAAAFDLPIEPHAGLVSEVMKLPAGTRRDSLLRLTTIPRESELVYASGLKWPIIRVRNVWVLPGVPSFFRERLTALDEHLRGPPIFAAAVYCATAESELVPVIDRVVSSHERVEIGSYPVFDRADYKTKLTIDGDDQGAVDAAVLAFEQALPDGSVLRVER